MKVAYLINQYPSVSHTFIRREICALEGLGVEVTRVSIRGWDLPLVDDSDIRERAATRYVLRKGVMPLLAAYAKCFIRDPRAACGALALAVRMWRHSDRTVFVHFAYVLEAAQIAVWLHEERVQHLHAHFCTNSTEVAMQCSQLGGTSYSFTSHGSDLMDRPASLSLSEKTSRSAFSVAVCSYGRSQLMRWIPYQIWPKVHVVRCGLDSSFWVKGSVNIRKDTLHLVCVGRLSKEKGQILLLQAFERLRSLGENIDLTLVGDGPLRNDIQDLCKELNILNDVNFVGWQDANGVLSAIAKSNALIVPSLSEGLPVVIMEAMAMGRVVIAPFLAGIPELVTNGDTGWLFHAGDPISLGDAIQKLCRADADTINSMGVIAQNRVRLMHDANLSAKALFALFDAL